jgi:hypothetical protein
MAPVTQKKTKIRQIPFFCSLRLNLGFRMRAVSLTYDSNRSTQTHALKRLRVSIPQNIQYRSLAVLTHA